MGSLSEKPTAVQQIQNDTGSDVEKEQQSLGEGGYFRIFRYGSRKEYMMHVAGVVFAMASGVGVAMVNLIFGQFITVVTGYTTGAASSDELRKESSRLALYFFYLGLGRFFVTYLYSSLFTLAAYGITRNIRREYLKSGLRQEIGYFDSGVGGSISMQAAANGKLIQGGISEKLGLLIQGLSAFISAFALAFATQWKLTLITSCITPAILIITGTASARNAAIDTKVLAVNARAASLAESILSSARTIQAFGLRKRLVGGLNKHLTESARLGHKKNPIIGTFFSAEYFVIYAGMGLCFWQAIRMIARGEVEQPGDVFTVLMSVITASSSLTSIAPYMVDFTKATVAATELFQLMDRASSIDPFDEKGEKPQKVPGHVEIENVTFSYPMRPTIPVLEDFSLNIPAGKVTALVGASGSGKSTIVGLLERWYNPSAGTIKLDGKPIDKLNLQWLRQHVRLVQQEPVLFSGSVYENIINGLVGTPWETDSREEKMVRVQNAAKVAFAHDFISALPDGYDTVIGERGGLLSGGQKQRVAIARSIISEPRILLLDEATSALDPHAEEVVQKALSNVSQGRTTITIAHKLATIRTADNIVVMRQGKVLEQGTHETLMSQDGAYARLVQAQDLSVKTNDEPDETSSSDSGDDTDNEPGDKNVLDHSLTRYSTTTRKQMDARLVSEDFEKWKRVGFFATLHRLISMTPEMKWRYLRLLLAIVVAAGTFPGQAMLMSRLVNVFQYTGSEMEEKGNFFALMNLVIAIGCLIVYFIIGYTANSISTTFGSKCGTHMVDDIVRQDLQFFDRPENTTGALAERVTSYPYSIFELMGFNIALISISALGVVACSIFALVQGWKLGVVIVFAGLPPMILAGHLRMKLESAMDVKISHRFSTSASIASEAIGAIRTVSSLSLEPTVLDRYTAELDAGNGYATKPVLLTMIPFAFTQSVEYSFMALGFWYGCRLVSFGEMDIVSFFSAYLGVFFAGQQASVMYGFASSITKAVNAANYMFWLSELQPSIRETEDNRAIGPKECSPLELKDVHFSYPLRPEARVLRGINLAIQKGQFVAFVGASGCGKSTMISMLERFYDPVKGHIKIDDRNIDEMNPWLYRNEVALVQQEPILYPETIRRNIAMGLPSDEDDSPVSDEQIIAACRAANAWDFICSLPDGLETPCGSNGLQLSGGQRQRIAIARALIRKPRVLLLDEATSALDTQSERVVQDAINEAAASGDRITVAVAHRLSTIRHADVICVFQDGRIVERGTHEQLIALGGIYRGLCESQNLGA
ncbi:unnamed protein product [Clonostachys rhizophaga]|uniref:Uncharacterized protein n=1 Tax=Clonostachys rhizophaga TaxID=160324 RepID=A0A9N9YL16_9HYPO|nr:unnamed protein product [Clonostachys rhizophaga]